MSCPTPTSPFAISHHSRPFAIRGGGTTTDTDEEYDDTMFDVIASFESELAEIRREAEIEAENEMEKLREVIGPQRQYNREEDEEDIDWYVEEEAGDEGVWQDGEEGEYPEEESEMLDDEGRSEWVQRDERGGESDVDLQPVQEDEETIYMKDDNVQIQEEDERTIYEPREDIDQLEGESELSENEVGVPLPLKDGGEFDGEDVAQDVAITELINEPGEEEVVISIEESVVSVETDDGEIEEEAESVAIVERLKKTQPQKERKAKSIKTKSKKKARKIIHDDGEMDDIHGYGSTSVSMIQEKEVQSPPQTGLRYYLQTDLVRALVLFIATVVLSLWMQRLQRQMEAEGI